MTSDVMDEFLDRFNSYPVAQKILVFAILVATVFAGFWFLIYSPMSGSYEQKNRELTKKIDRRQELKNLKESQTRMLKKVQELQLQVEVAEDKLPSSAQLPKLLKHIHDKAKTAGLEIKNFQRLSDSSKDYYVEIPVEMKLDGTYGELSSFLQYVSDMNRIVNIRNLKLTRKEKSRGELTVTALATTYRYKEQNKKNKKK